MTEKDLKIQELRRKFAAVEAQNDILFEDLCNKMKEVLKLKTIISELELKLVEKEANSEKTHE